MNVIYLVGNIDLSENTGATKHFADLYFTLKSYTKDLKVFVRELPLDYPDSELKNFIKVPHIQGKRLGKWGTLLMVLSFELVLFFKLFALNISNSVKGIYLRQSNLNFAVPLIVKLFNINLIVEANSLLLEDLKESGVKFLGGLEKILEKFTFKNSAHIRVITKNMKKYFLNIFSLEDERFSVIPNGHNFDKYNSNIKKIIKKDNGNSCFQLLYVGLLHKREGVHILLEALSLLNSQHSFQLDIIGNGPHQLDFEKQVSKYNLFTKVHFLGEMHPRKLEEYYLKADICFAPLIRERNEITGVSPVKIFEYLAHKCPLICSDLPGLKFVGEYRCGIVVEPDSPLLLAEKIEWLMNNYNTEAEAIATNGYNYTKENHNWQKLSQEIISRCNQVFE